MEEIRVMSYTKKEVMESNDWTEAEFVEAYGTEDVVRIYWAEAYDEAGCMAGVEYDDGSCSVFGCGLDEEFITFGRMLEVLVGEFL